MKPIAYRARWSAFGDRDSLDNRAWSFYDKRPPNNQHRQVESLYPEAVMDALCELIRLKNLKDQLDAEGTDYNDGVMAEYRYRLGRAWAAAKAIVERE